MRLIDPSIQSEAVFPDMCRNRTFSNIEQKTIIEELFHEDGCGNYSEALDDIELFCCKQFKRNLVDEINNLEDVWLFSLQEPNMLLARKYLSTTFQENLGDYGKPLTKDLRSLTPFITTCQLSLGEVEIDCTDMFSPSMSMAGIVYTMNQASLKSMITNRTNQLFRKKLFNDKVMTNLDKAFKGKFYLRLVCLPIYESLNKMVIHDKETIPDFLANPILLTPNQNHIIKIKASLREAHHSLKDMPLVKRQCKFKDETHNLKLFHQYSRSSCLLECLLGRIKRKCNCLPWDMIRQQNETVLPCILHKLKCPNEVISSSSDRGCNCPLDCKEIKYSHTIQMRPFDVDEFCAEELNKENSTFMNSPHDYDMYTHLRDPFGINKFHARKLATKTRRCQSISPRGFQMEISYEGSTGQKIIKMKRFTFSSMLSSLGTSLIIQV